MGIYVSRNQKTKCKIYISNSVCLFFLCFNIEKNLTNFLFIFLYERPIRSVTLNGGMEMTAWFDILGLHPGAAQDEQGLKQSSQICKNL